MSIKNLGATGHAFKAENFSQVALNLKENNIKIIQLTPSKISTEFDWSLNCYTPALAHYIKKKLKDVHISSLGCYINLASDDDSEINFFKKNIEFAKYISADMICTETGFKNTIEETRSKSNYLKVVENGKKIAECAEKFGVTIAIEPGRIHSLYSAEILKKFIDDVNSPNICCVLDVVGLLAYMTESPITRQYSIIDSFFDLLRDKIRLVHLKDFDFINGETVGNIPIGKGKMDFQYLFKKIDENICAIDMIVESVNPAYITAGIDYLKKLL